MPLDVGGDALELEGGADMSAAEVEVEGEEEEDDDDSAFGAGGAATRAGDEGRGKV